MYPRENGYALFVAKYAIKQSGGTVLSCQSIREELLTAAPLGYWLLHAGRSPPSNLEFLKISDWRK